MPDGRKPPKVKIIPGDSPFQRLGAGGKTYDRSHLKVFDKFDPTRARGSTAAEHDRVGTLGNCAR
jgi:hypothetical protein